MIQAGKRAGKSRVYVPVGFNANSYPRPDDARYFVGTLARKHALADLDVGGYAILNRRVMERTLDRRFVGAMLDKAQADGVIETDNYYVPSIKSRGYRLTREYLAQSAVSRELTDKFLLRRMERERDRARLDKQNRRLPIHDQLEDWCRLISLEPGALTRLDELPPETRCGQSVLVQNIFDRNQKPHFSVSEWGRVFNPITGLERSLRGFMKIDGQPVGGFDISCAQPALLALLVARLQSYPVSQKWDHIPCPLVGAPAPLPALPLPDPLPAVLPLELSRFLEMVRSGCLYREMLRLLCREESAETLAWVKKRFLADVLAKRRWSRTKAGKLVLTDYPSEVEQAFRALCPTLWEFVRAVNRDDHGLLIRCLQKLEAWLVVEHVAPRTGCPVVTLHDGLYFREQDRELVQQALEGAFTATGFCGTYKHC